jgi:calcineurin-like phosphoesterase family protein
MTTKTIFTSDLHFRHKNIVEYTNRDIETTKQEHDEWLVDLWNSSVDKGDLVWHLGDFCFARNEAEIETLLKRLNGVKHFIKGNHDDREVLNTLKKNNAIAWWGDYREIKVCGNSTVLFHFPIANWHKQHHGAFHLHGHSHGSYFVEDGKILDVGLDSAYNIYGKHKFFTEKDVLEYMQGRSVVVNDHHTAKKEKCNETCSSYTCRCF